MGQLTNDPHETTNPALTVISTLTLTLPHVDPLDITAALGVQKVLLTMLASSTLFREGAGGEQSTCRVGATTQKSTAVTLRACHRDTVQRSSDRRQNCSLRVIGCRDGRAQRVVCGRARPARGPGEAHAASLGSATFHA